MGWGHGELPDGREVGYAVAAVCDEPGCEAVIDRGMAYLCGEMPGAGDGGEQGCGAYFCGEHLWLSPYTRHPRCGSCMADIEADIAERVE